jgi:hypothetical protein
MRRFAVMVLVVMACSGTSKPAKTAGDGSGSQAIYAKKISVSWGIQGNDVFLQLTDETGKQTSYPVGTYAGECKIMTPAPDMKAVSGVTCTSGSDKVELDAVVSGPDIIVVKGNGADPMSRDEVTRVAAPGGAAVVVGQ